jgi:hypothetical protein
VPGLEVPIAAGCRISFPTDNSVYEIAWQRYDRLLSEARDVPGAGSKQRRRKRSATHPQALAGTRSIKRYLGRTVHRDRFSDKEPSPRGLASYPNNGPAAVWFGPAPAMRWGKHPRWADAACRVTKKSGPAATFASAREHQHLM